MADVSITSLPYTISGAGDRYLLPAGQLLQGILTIAAANVTIESDGDSEAQLSTARQITGSWTYVGGGEWYADLPSGVTNSNPAATYILIINGEVIKKGGTIGALSIGYWQYDTGNFRVYMNNGGSAPSGTIYVGTGSCVLGSTSTMPSGLIMRGVAIWGANNGLHLRINGATHPTDMLVDQCRLYRNARAGLLLEGGERIELRESYIAHNQATSVKFGNSDTNANSAVVAASVRRCVLEWNNSVDSDSNSEGHVIDVGAQGSAAIVEGNEFRHNGYCSGVAYRFTYDPATQVSLDGVEVASVHGNNFHHNYIGCVALGASSAHTRLSQGVAIHGNLFTRNGPANISTDGFLQSVIIFDGTTVSTYDASDCYIANNTFAENGGDEASANQYRPACFYTSVNTTHNHTLPRLNNNVFSGNSTPLDVTVNFIGTGAASMNWANNLFWRTDGGDFAYIRTSSGDAGAKANTAAEWLSLVGAEALVENPLLDSSYRPTAASPCRANGIYIPGARHYGGKRMSVVSPTIGAHGYYAAREVADDRNVRVVG
jgi:hypothetical protein